MTKITTRAMGCLKVAFISIFLICFFVIDARAESAVSKELKVQKKKTEEHLNHLVLREKELDEREVFVKKMEERLQVKKEELLRGISELEKLKENIAKKLENRVEEDREKLKKLISFYSNMQPERASKIISQLDESLAVSILSGMKKKNVAEIMNLLPIDKARDLSEKFTGYRRKTNHIK